APAIEENILGRAQAQEIAIDVIDAKDDDAAAGALDFAPQRLRDFLGGDAFESFVDHRVASGEFGGVGTRHIHQRPRTAVRGLSRGLAVSWYGDYINPLTCSRIPRRRCARAGGHDSD